MFSVSTLYNIIPDICRCFGDLENIIISDCSQEWLDNYSSDWNEEMLNAIASGHSSRFFNDERTGIARRPS